MEINRPTFEQLMGDLDLRAQNFQANPSTSTQSELSRTIHALGELLDQDFYTYRQLNDRLEEIKITVGENAASLNFRDSILATIPEVQDKLLEKMILDLPSEKLRSVLLSMSDKKLRRDTFESIKEILTLKSHPFMVRNLEILPWGSSQAFRFLEQITSITKESVDMEKAGQKDSDLYTRSEFRDLIDYFTRENFISLLDAEQDQALIDHIRSDREKFNFLCLISLNFTLASYLSDDLKIDTLRAIDEGKFNTKPYEGYGITITQRSIELPKCSFSDYRSIAETLEDQELFQRTQSAIELEKQRNLPYIIGLVLHSDTHQTLTQEEIDSLREFYQAFGGDKNSDPHLFFETLSQTIPQRGRKKILLAFAKAYQSNANDALDLLEQIKNRISIDRVEAVLKHPDAQKELLPYFLEITSKMRVDHIADFLAAITPLLGPDNFSGDITTNKNSQLINLFRVLKPKKYSPKLISNALALIDRHSETLAMIFKEDHFDSLELDLHRSKYIFENISLEDFEEVLCLLEEETSSPFLLGRAFEKTPLLNRLVQKPPQSATPDLKKTKMARIEMLLTFIYEFCDQSTITAQSIKTMIAFAKNTQGLALKNLMWFNLDTKNYKRMTCDEFIELYETIDRLSNKFVDQRSIKFGIQRTGAEKIYDLVESYCNLSVEGRKDYLKALELGINASESLYTIIENEKLDFFDPSHSKNILTTSKLIKLYPKHANILTRSKQLRTGKIDDATYRRLDEILERYGYHPLIEELLCQTSNKMNLHILYPILDKLLAEPYTSNPDYQQQLFSALLNFYEERLTNDQISNQSLVTLLEERTTIGAQLEAIQALFPADLKTELSPWIIEIALSEFRTRDPSQYISLIAFCRKALDKERALQTLALIDQLSDGSNERWLDWVDQCSCTPDSRNRLDLLRFLLNAPKFNVKYLPTLEFAGENHWEELLTDIEKNHPDENIEPLAKRYAYLFADCEEWSKEECKAFHRAVYPLPHRDQLIAIAVKKNPLILDSILDDAPSAPLLALLKDPANYPENLREETAKTICFYLGLTPHHLDGEKLNLLNHPAFFKAMITLFASENTSLSETERKEISPFVRQHAYLCDDAQLDWIIRQFDPLYADISPKLIERSYFNDQLLTFLQSPRGVEFIEKHRESIWDGLPRIQSVIEELYPLSEPNNLQCYSCAFSQSDSEWSNSSEIRIRCPQQLLQLRSPEILKKFASHLNKIPSENLSRQQLSVSYIGSPVIDAGAARRDFIRQLLSESLKAMRVMPEGSEKQELYTALGDVLHFLFRSGEHLPMGNLLDKEVFELILRLTPEETAHSYRSLTLCPTRRLELIDGLQAYFGDLDKRGENSTFNNLKKLMKWQGGEEGREAAIAAIKQYYAETLCEEPPPLIDAEGRWIHPQSLRSLKREIFDSYTQQIGLDKKLRPIFSMARELSQLAKEGVTAKELRRKIQGHLDVEALHEAIKYTDVPEATVDLIRNWIDANRDNHDVLELFVCFLLGSSSLPAENWKECIKIACVERGTAMRVSAQSCFGQMNLSMPHTPEEQTRLEVAVRWVLGLCEKLDYETLATFDEG